MRTMTRLVSCSALAAGILATTFARSAAAQSFGQQGDFSFGVDRLMGIYFLHEDPASLTMIGLGATAPVHPYTTARFAVDGFIIDNLSLGGSFMFWNVDEKHGGNSSGALFAPRVGYVLQFSDAFGFWPRAGLTYRNFDSNEELAVTLEGMFYGSPAPHFAFTFGPVLDLGVVGTGSEAVNFGLLTAGIMGWI